MANPTNPLVAHDRRLEVSQGLQSKSDTGWLAGFSNTMHKELGEWFGTRRWLWQSLIWLVLINGFIALMLFLVPTIAPSEMEAEPTPPPNIMAFTLYFSFVTIAGSIAMIILVQDEVIQEKQTGTAAWILSKPVARPAFLLSKFTSNVIGGLIFIVVLPAVVMLIEIYLAEQQITSIVPFLAGLGAVMLVLIFYVSLMILLGVFFEQRGPVLGIAFGVLVGGMIAGQLVPQISYILPLNMDQVALTLVQGQALPAMAISQLTMTAVWSLLFMAAALRRFQLIEL